jgi:lipopolysaccharide transport system ATP-binding protein
MSFAIRVEELSKRYQLGMTHSGSIRELANRTLRRLMRQPEPPSMVHSALAIHDESSDGQGCFWALRDVSFEVQPGEVVGIIGRNGAGKSTLLKILSQITSPTSGRVEMNGRAASLLEVGTGFHPELTGRENVFLNGALLGLSKTQIREKFQEIVAFAEVEKFIDTPVKRYSSGMYVRLAFAVAAHLEPEILIVDEVLAVGDAVFQKRCLGKMTEVARGGRTILFVSHNLAAVRALCTRGIFLDQGLVMLDASSQEAATTYLTANQGGQEIANIGIRNRLDRTTGDVRFTRFLFQDDQGRDRFSFREGETVRIILGCKVYRPVPHLGLLVELRSGETNETLTSIKAVVSETDLAVATELTINLTLPAISLRPGDFPLYICVNDKFAHNFYDVIDKNVSLPNLTIAPADPDHAHMVGCFSVPWSLGVEMDQK